MTTWPETTVRVRVVMGEEMERPGELVAPGLAMVPAGQGWSVVQMGTGLALSPAVLCRPCAEAAAEALAAVPGWDRPEPEIQADDAAYAAAREAHRYGPCVAPAAMRVVDHVPGQPQHP